MKVEPITNKYFDSMSYLVISDNKCLIVDPSFDGDKIIDVVLKNNYDVVAIILTHGHNDHIFSVEQIVNKFNCPVYCSKQCAIDMLDPYLNLSYNEEYTVTYDCSPIILSEGINKIDIFEFKVINVYGHSLGCIIYEFEDFLLTGDFLFKRAVGTVKYHNSSYELMVESVNKFNELYKDVEKVVYPGHREQTTIQTEFKTNPFLKRPKSIKFLN